MLGLAIYFLVGLGLYLFVRPLVQADMERESDPVVKAAIAPLIVCGWPVFLLVMVKEFFE